ncbi:hypothetical protein AAMO2058_001322100 [Amorphochlora amoebiformis]
MVWGLLLLHILRAEGKCELEFAENGATFDLSTFEARGKYHLQDVLDEPDEPDDFEYEFSICQALPTPPDPTWKCDSKTNGSIFQLSRNWKTNNRSCSYLGSMQNASWGILDETDSVTGLWLEIMDGDKCTNGELRPKRFRMFFECEGIDTVEPITNVSEPNGCIYEVTFRSIYACPTECIENNILCGNHGICSLDGVTKKAHCFCNDGYFGDYCTETKTQASGKGSKAPSPAAVLAGICLGLVLILIAQGILLFVWVRRLKSEHSYGNFERMVFDADEKDESYDN